MLKYVGAVHASEALADSGGLVSRGICGSLTLVLVPHVFARCHLHWPNMQSYYLRLLLSILEFWIIPTKHCNHLNADAFKRLQVSKECVYM